MNRIDEEMKKNFSIQKNENIRLQQQINNLKIEKTQLQQKYLVNQRKIADLELTLGLEAEENMHELENS